MKCIDKGIIYNCIMNTYLLCRSIGGGVHVQKGYAPSDTPLSQSAAVGARLAVGQISLSLETNGATGMIISSHELQYIALLS